MLLRDGLDAIARETSLICQGHISNYLALKVPIHVRVRLGSGSNEPNSSVYGVPRAGLGRVRLGSPGPSVGLGSLLARTCVGGPEPGSEPCQLPCLKHS
jgi:hypothetical protein